MAKKGQKVESLYVSLGLDVSELESDYLRADQTVTQNMRRMQQIIKNTKLEIDVAVKDPNLSVMEKARSIQQAEERQIKAIREELELATRAYQAEAASAGESATSTLRQKNNLLRIQSQLNTALQEQKSADATAILSNGARQAANQEAQLQKVVEQTTLAYRQQAEVAGKTAESTVAAQKAMVAAQEKLNTAVQSHNGMIFAPAERTAKRTSEKTSETSEQSNEKSAALKKFEESGKKVESSISALDAVVMTSFISPIMAMVSSFSAFRTITNSFADKLNQVSNGFNEMSARVNRQRALGVGVPSGRKQALSDLFFEIDRQAAEYVKKFKKPMAYPDTSKFSQAMNDVWNSLNNQLSEYLHGLTDKNLRQSIINSNKWGYRKDAKTYMGANDFDQNKSFESRYTNFMSAFGPTNARDARLLQDCNNEIRRIDAAAKATKIDVDKMFSGVKNKEYLKGLALEAESSFPKLQARIKDVFQHQSQALVGRNLSTYMDTELELRKMAQLRDAEAKAQSSLGSKISNIPTAALNIASGEINKIKAGWNAVTAAEAGSKAELRAFVMLLGTVGKVGGTFVAITAIFAAVGVAITKMAHSSIEAKNNVYMLAQQLHTTVGDAAKLSGALKITGANPDAAIASIMRLDKSIMTAGKDGNEATRALAAFGVTLTDGNGALLSYDQQLRNLADGYKKAKEAGLEEEYLTATLGVRGREMVGVLEDYAKAMDQVTDKSHGLVNVSILDPEKAHRLSMEYNQLSAQMSTVGSAFSQAFAPAAEELMPELIDLFRDIAILINNHKEGIILLSRAFGQAIGLGIDLLDGLIKLLDGALILFGGIIDIMRQIARAAATCGAYIEAAFNGKNVNTEKLQEALDIIDKAYGKEKKSDTDGGLAIDVAKQKELLNMMRDNSAEERKAQQEASEAERKRKQEEEEAARNHEQALQTMRQANQIYYHSYHSEAENAIYDIQNEEEAQIHAAKTSEQVYAAKSLAAAKYYQLEAEGQKAADRNIAQANQIYTQMANYGKGAWGDYNTTVAQIREEERSQLLMAKTATESQSVVELAAAKMAQAWQTAVEKIRSLNESLQDKIFHLTHNDTENQLYDLRREVEKAVQEGADVGLANQYYSLKQQDILHKANGGQGPTGYHDIIIDGGTVKSQSYGLGRDQIDIRPVSTSMSAIGARMPQISETVAKIPVQNQQLLTKLDTVSQAMVKNNASSGAIGNHDTVDYNLNVNVTGLQDLDHQVAQSAAKKILDRMPNIGISSTRVSYAV